jgi:hypothetical protein
MINSIENPGYPLISRGDIQSHVKMEIMCKAKANQTQKVAPGSRTGVVVLDVASVPSMLLSRRCTFAVSFAPAGYLARRGEIWPQSPILLAKVLRYEEYVVVLEALVGSRCI